MSMVKHKRGTPSTLDVQHEAELKALANKSDEDIDYSDIPPSSDEQWSNADAARSEQKIIQAATWRPSSKITSSTPQTLPESLPPATESR